MLGIRRFGSTQIDLWQGEPIKFLVDLSWSGSMESGQDFSCSSVLKTASAKGIRHVSLFCKDPSMVDFIMDSVSSFLNSKDQNQKNPRRITVIAPTSEIYDALQAKLFSTFKDI